MGALDQAAHDLLSSARTWAAQDPDPGTRAEAEALVDRCERGDEDALREVEDAFHGRLLFGTAGLRGRVGAGPNRMNRVVVAQTSAGFARFLLERAARGETSSPPSVVIGYDARPDSAAFARDTAEIMAGAGVRTTLLPAALPTPVTAFAVRHLETSAGVMITASHNPPCDNGYKVYLGDEDRGSQIVPPVDAEIAALIDRAAEFPVDAHPRSGSYEISGPEVLEAYIRATAATLSAGFEQDRSNGAAAPLAAAPLAAAPLTVAYTALHGVGSAPARRVFEAAGLPGVTAVPEQDRPDGAFPTVEFPNPEEADSLSLAYALARDIDADVVVAHDPDADRLGIALPDPSAPAGYRRLSGNELGLLLGWQAAERERVRAEAAGRAPSGALACTLVSSPALRAVAEQYGLDYAETLSGFKWVSRVPGLLFGYEEALGYLTHPDVVSDKDGISASADAIALVRDCKARGRTVWDLLDEASLRFGHFASAQVVVRLGSMREVEALSARIREAPPNGFGGVPIVEAADLMTPGLAAVPSNVLRYDLADGSRVMIRPSGTEPKLKIYLDACCVSGALAERRAAASAALQQIEGDVRTYLDERLG